MMVTVISTHHSLKTRWYRTAAEIESELHQRLHKTTSGKPPLRYFDGSVMESYLKWLKRISVDNKVKTLDAVMD